MKYKCLIVDDEHLAHNVLIQYIDKIDRLELTGQCYSAIEAISFLTDTSVDILFLDINMPDLTGLELLEALKNPPKVILTTAYSEFALEGFEHGVVDYLMKPIRFSRFIKAVNRILNLDTSKSTTLSTPIQEPAILDYIEIKEDFMKIKINFADIRYIQAYGNFLKIYTNSKMHMTSATMKSYEKILPKNKFIRIHKSYFINKSHITEVHSDKIVIKDIELPIGNSYKKLVKDKLS